MSPPLTQQDIDVLYALAGFAFCTWMVLFAWDLIDDEKEED